jgi:hypothetical protein
LVESPGQARIRLAAYGLLAVPILLVWTFAAETELPMPAGVIPFASLVRLADGSGAAPFVYRRLLPDAARGLAAVVPDSVWDGIDAFTRGAGPLSEKTRSILDYLHWNRRDYPVLFSGYFLIGLSIVGVMCVTRRMVIATYLVSRAEAAFLGAVAGILLLGGCGLGYGEYPYDLPNTFVFNLSLLGMMTGGWWTFPAFLVTVYSKETSILLVPAYLLLCQDVPLPRRIMVAIAMVVTVAAVRAAIIYWYPAPPAGYLYSFGRNVSVISKAAIYDMWAGGVVLLTLAGVVRTAPRRLAWVAASIILPLVGASIFRGWIDERRALLEGLPMVFLIMLPWCFQQLGRDLKPKASTNA